MNHDEPLLMYVFESSAPFYACRKYMRKDSTHPEGHDQDEPSCTNRLSFYMTSSILQKINELIEEEMDGGYFGDYTNLSLSYKGCRVRILGLSEGLLKLGVKNEKEVNVWTSSSL